MPGNRSLDEFVVDDSEGGLAAEATADTVETDPAAGPASAPTEADDGATIEPVAETFAWAADGGPCASCGEPAERRWRDDAGLVGECCKEW